MKIRKASRLDSGDIARIEWESGYRWNRSKKECMSLSKRIFDEGYSTIYILDDLKDKIGYFSVSRKGKLFYLNYFSIKKKFQGRGFSKSMMNKIISLAKRHNSSSIELTVWSRNFPAISLYTKYKFYVIGIKKNYYKKGDDKLVMRRELR